MSASRLGLARQASKTQLKARVALDGPSGAGKTWTSLEWATVLAEGGRILHIDTEHGSAALYADHFDFETVPWDPPYNPTELADTIKDAVKGGYAVIDIDSLSHFWEGEGGTRDMVDAAAEKAKGNTYAGWKVGTPALRYLIDTMLAADAHVIATMRSKMEYVLETDQRGRQVPRKVGMAPVMRAGVEYEFTLVGDLDLDHRIMITKSRCSALADELIQPGRAAEAAERFLAWLNAGEAPPPPPPEPTIPDDIVADFDALPDDAQAKILAWAKVDTIDAAPRDLWDRLRGLIDRAATAATSSDPDGPGVADDPVREPETTSEGSSPSVDGDHEPDPAEDAPHGNATSSAGNGPLHPLQKKMHALTAKAWPQLDDAKRTIKRHGLISAITEGRTDSSSKLDADALEDVCAALEQIAEGRMEVHQRATGEWELRVRGGAKRTPATTGGEAA